MIEKRDLVESMVNEILYKYIPCNRALAGVVFSEEIATRKTHLTNLVKNIVVKFHLY